MPYSNKPIRRTSLIGPWGVGAIVPFPDDESLMIAGLDMWRYNNPESFKIIDERLQRRLGVQELRWPPDYRERNADSENCFLKIPTIRFPRWHYCPFCGTMTKTTLYQKQPECDCYQWPRGRKCNPSFKQRRKLIPERFVVICENGHIDDFPVAEWLHYGTGQEYRPMENGGKCKIRRSTGGTSASLSGVFYECSCGAKRSIAGATIPGALGRINYSCKGNRIWLGEEGNTENKCNCQENQIRVVLRGATNVWFADTRSSIYIPIDGSLESRKILAILDKYFETLNSSRINGEFNRSFIDMLAKNENINSDDLYNAFLKRADGISSTIEVNEEISEDSYRFAEYAVLTKSSGNDAQKFHSINYPISHYNPIIKKYFSSISLVPKLLETRAFVGFSRVEPKVEPISEKKKNLRLGNGNWLPAIQVQGEGIFFEFNKDVLEEWSQKEQVKARLQNMQKNFCGSKFAKNDKDVLRPEFILIHTFAHLLINQLAFECGYGSSSIRERIYCEKTSNNLGMTGVLIYTASGDSEGSLGGLVRQGTKGHIEDTIRDAIKNAAWCSSDPVCIQSLGQGPESLNLAACHNCALLPETCCECGNRLLDRGLIVGTLDNNGSEIGFFKDLLL